VINIGLFASNDANEKTHWTSMANPVKSLHHMKNNTLTAVLNGVLAVSLLLSVFLCLQFISLTRQARSISGQIGSINAYRSSMQALANDCLAYSEKNHAIDPILESVGLKPRNVPNKQPGTR
jgi:hypothetical protein